MRTRRELTRVPPRTACKRCELCFTRQYGCTNSSCYCHSHSLEPRPAAERAIHDYTDPECVFWARDGASDGVCRPCRQT